MSEPTDDFGRRHLEASYEGVVFPTDDCDVDGGHDFAVHKRYGKSGAEHEHTGSNPNSGKLKAIIMNDIGYGQIWPSRYLDLVRKLLRVPIGTLVHPIYGELRVAILRWSVKSSAKVRSGYIVEIDWQQDNGSEFDGVVGWTTNRRESDVAGATSNAAAAADATSTSLGGPSGYIPVSTSINVALERLDDPSATYQEVLSAFRDADKAITSNIELCEVDATYAQLLLMLEETNASFIQMSRRFVNVASPSYYTVPREMSVQDMAIEIFGDINRVPEIYAANNIVHHTLRPGTRIIIPGRS